jgi:AraC-like DNA-binding protein
MIGKLFLWQGCTVYCGPVADTTEHRHHAAQISLSQDAPFSLHTPNHEAQANFASIPADIPHRFTGGLSQQVIVLLDAETAAGNAVTKRGLKFDGGPQGIQPNWPNDLAMARTFVDWLLGDLNLPPSPRTRDPRIEKVLVHIAQKIETAQSAVDLAAIANLSVDHFLHLFTRELGLPLRRYVLWRRILSSVVATTEGADLTKAAYRGGFSDSAHFSRVFRANFGLKPSLMLKDSRFIQVFADFET